jgi:hypothetical protein
MKLTNKHMIIENQDFLNEKLLYMLVNNKENININLDNYTKEELLNLFEYAFVDKDCITKSATKVLFDYYLKNFKGKNINFYELLENANNHDFTTSITDVPKQLLKSVIICLEIKINSLMKKQNFYRLQTSIP